MKTRLIRLLWLLPSVLAAAYFALWACAPAAYVDPPLSATGARQLVGVAAVYSDELGRSDDDGFDGQLWWQRRWERVGFGLMGAAGQSALLSGGGYFRVHFIDMPHLRLAGDVHAGGMYAGLALPLVVPISSTVEWYVAPWATYRSSAMLRLPTGFRFWMPSDVMLGIEGGAGTLSGDSASNAHEVWGALSAGYAFGRPSP